MPGSPSSNSSRSSSSAPAIPKALASSSSTKGKVDHVTKKTKSSKDVPKKVKSVPDKGTTPAPAATTSTQASPPQGAPCVQTPASSASNSTVGQTEHSASSSAAPAPPQEGAAPPSAVPPPQQNPAPTSEPPKEAARKVASSQNNTHDSSSDSTLDDDVDMSTPSKSSAPAPILNVFDPTSGARFPLDAFNKLTAQEKGTTATLAFKRRRFNNATNCCLKCGNWFKVSHACKLSIPYDFTIPDHIVRTFNLVVQPAVAPPPDPSVDDNLLAPCDWDLSIFAELPVKEIFSSPETFRALPDGTPFSFGALMQDLIPLALNQKEGALEALLMLPCLLAPGTLRGKEASSVILENCSLFRAGHFKILLERRAVPLNPGVYDPLRRAESLVKAGDLSGAVKALSSEGVINTADHVTELQALHPGGVPPELPAPTPSNQLTPPFTESNFISVIRRSKWRKAADTLGWRMDFLKAITTKDAVDKSINLLYHLCRRMAMDTTFIPSRLKPYFFGAKLIAVKKKNGGIRPIAIGTIFHKLISSSIMRHIKHCLPGFFAPVQFGVGFPGGTENIIHGIRNIRASSPDKILVSLDLSNAFNSVHRQAFIDQVKSSFPNLLPWVSQAYGFNSVLLARGCPLISSITGVRQGDPMGPFLFCLAIHPALDKISKLVDSLSYMDDIYLLGTPVEMVKALKSLEADFTALHLKINFEKSYANVEVPGYKDKLPISADPEILRSPLSCETPVTKLNDKILKAIENIAKMDDPQVALLLLRQINNGSLTHTLRTVCPEATKAVTTLMHDKVRDALATILRTSLTGLDRVEKRIYMPLGPGLGFTPLADIAKPAFEASLLQCTLRLRGVNEARFPIPKFPDVPDASTALYPKLLSEAFKSLNSLSDGPLEKLQHSLVVRSNSKLFNESYQSLSPANKRIVDSTLNTHAGGWLTAIPSTPELTIHRAEMRLAVKLFLGLPVKASSRTCPHCSVTCENSETFTQHCLICSVKKPLMHRHELIKHCVSDLCKAAGRYADVEPSIFGYKNASKSGSKPQSDSPLSVPGKKDQKRVDLLIHNFGSKGSDLAIDVSIANPFATSIKNPAPLSAAMAREKRKISKYASDCSKLKIPFHPFVLDAYGGFPAGSYHLVFMRLVRMIQSYEPVNWAAPTAKIYWLQRLSVALWTANAYKVMLIADPQE